MERRGFLKLFGVGASIVPLVGGMPLMDASAKLIEVPKVDIAVAQAIPSDFPLRPFLNQEKLRMQVNFVDKDWNLYSVEADTFITHMDRIDVTSFDDGPYRRYIPIGAMKWELRGIVVGESSMLQRAHDQRYQATPPR